MPLLRPLFCDQDSISLHDEQVVRLFVEAIQNPWGSEPIRYLLILGYVILVFAQHLVDWYSLSSEAGQEQHRINIKPIISRKRRC